MVANERGARRLTAVDRAAALLGLYVGQKATTASALAPDLVMVDAEPEADAAALIALCDWCCRFSPAVAVDPPDGLMLDITGVDHLWGGEAAMADDLIARLAASGIPARAAVAPTVGAAWALARFGPIKEPIIIAGSSLKHLSHREREVPAPAEAWEGEGLDGERGNPSPSHAQERARGDWFPLPKGEVLIAAALASLPVAALRLSPPVAAQIARLGLTTVGRLAVLPRDQLTRRFGSEVVLRLDQALGKAREALTYRRPPNPWFARLAFAEPISLSDDLTRVTRDIAVKLCARLEAEGQGARRFEIGFHRLDGVIYPLTIGLALPGRDAARIARLFHPRLETVDPGFGIEVVTLAALDVEPLNARQQRLDATREIAPEEGLAPLVDRLTNRLGAAAVWRAQARPSHIPERATARRPALSPASGEGWDPQRPRPVRLFRRPEPIEVVAPVPDDPPILFRWRGRTHRVRLAEGPERLAREWWRAPFEDDNPSRLRDYYRVEDQDGLRVWLFRAGLYSAENPAKWWLHGLFG